MGCVVGTKRPSPYNLHKAECFKKCWNKKDLKLVHRVNTLWIFTFDHEKAVKKYLSSMQIHQHFILHILKMYLPQIVINHKEKLYFGDSDRLEICHSYCHSLKHIKTRTPCFMRYYNDTFLSLKIFITGHKSVGKTEIKSKFELKSKSNFNRIKINSRPLRLVLIDLNIESNVENWTDLLSLMINSAELYLLVFSIDNRESLMKIETYYDKIKECRLDRTPLMDTRYACIMVGNKIDLRYDPNINHANIIQYDEALAVAKKLDMPYIEVSAKEELDLAFLFRQCCYEHWLEWAKEQKTF